MPVDGGREEQALFCWDSVMHGNAETLDENTILKISEVNKIIRELGFGIRRLSLIDACCTCSTRKPKGISQQQASGWARDIRFGVAECTFSAALRMFNLY